MSSAMQDLPGLYEPVEDPFGGEGGEAATSSPQNGDPPTDDDDIPRDNLYVAIDGITFDDLSDDERELLRTAIIDLTAVDFGEPVSDVRILGDETKVVEFQEVADAFMEPQER